jgi:hypothetical protein
MKKIEQEYLSLLTEDISSTVATRVLNKHTSRSVASVLEKAWTNKIFGASSSSIIVLRCCTLQAQRGPLYILGLALPYDNRQQRIHRGSTTLASSKTAE